MFTTKAVKPYKGTEIQVQGIGGVTYAQLMNVAKGLKTVKASGNTFTQVIAPIMVDPAMTTEINARVGSTIVLTVSDAANWNATVDDPTLAVFTPGGDQGTDTTNPGLSALAAGTTILHVSHGSETYEIALTITS